MDHRDIFAAKIGLKKRACDQTLLIITSANAEYVWQIPFGQVDSALNRDHTGTGLGLPLAKSLAEQHAGILEVESNPGKGTIVTLFLPLARKDAADPPLQLVIGGQDG